MLAEAGSDEEADGGEAGDEADHTLAKTMTHEDLISGFRLFGVSLPTRWRDGSQRVDHADCCRASAFNMNYRIIEHAKR